jgi:hypothetical protein
MNNLSERFGSVPFLLFGIGLLLLGVVAMNHVIDNFWPIDVGRLDLIRAAAFDKAEASLLLQAANNESIAAFLASVLVAATGLVFPLVFYLNRRFRSVAQPQFLVVLRQAMWVGLWVAISTWLRMNRSLGWGVAVLVAVVFVIFEFLLQVRVRAATAMD